jgi:hypothetical protein
VTDGFVRRRALTGWAGLLRVLTCFFGNFLAVLRAPSVCLGDLARGVASHADRMPRFSAGPPAHVRRHSGRIRVSLRMLACLGLLLPSGAQAADAVRRAFAIPEGDAKVTLKQFAAQSREQVLYSPDDVGGVRTQAVNGELAPMEALACMLERTPLRARQDERTKAISIIAKAPSQAPPARSSASHAPHQKPSTPSVPSQMKSRTFVSAIVSALSVFTPNLAPGQTAGADPGSPPLKEAPILLSPFTVDTSKDYGYRRTHAVTATRIGMPTIESPLNIQVIGADFLRDIGADNIQDAFRYTSGISTDDGNEFRPAVRVRGFAPSALFRDGFLRYYNFDIDGIEQIEVVKGPNAVFFGRTSPGGIINYTTKKAQFRNETSFQATLGDHAYYKGLLDSQVSLMGGRMGARVVASKVDAESWLDEKTQKKDFVLANVIFRPFANLELYGAVEHTDNLYRGTGFYGMVYNSAFARAKAAGTSPAGETMDGWRRARVHHHAGPASALRWSVVPAWLQLQQKRRRFLRGGT